MNAGRQRLTYLSCALGLLLVACSSSDDASTETVNFGPGDPNVVVLVGHSEPILHWDSTTLKRLKESATSKRGTGVVVGTAGDVILTAAHVVSSFITAAETQYICVIFNQGFLEPLCEKRSNIGWVYHSKASATAGLSFPHDLAALHWPTPFRQAQFSAAARLNLLPVAFSPDPPADIKTLDAGGANIDSEAAYRISTNYGKCVDDNDTACLDKAFAATRTHMASGTSFMFTDPLITIYDYKTFDDISQIAFYPDRDCDAKLGPQTNPGDSGGPLYQIDQGRTQMTIYGAVSNANCFPLAALSETNVLDATQLNKCRSMRTKYIGKSRFFRDYVVNVFNQIKQEQSEARAQSTIACLSRFARTDGGSFTQTPADSLVLESGTDDDTSYDGTATQTFLSSITNPQAAQNGLFFQLP